MASEGDNDGLFSSTVDISKWQTALLCYEEVVELKAAGKSKKASKKEETLQELDEWYQMSLPDLIASRDEPHLTHTELVKLMKWKLTRGKFRPRLTEMVKQNTSEEVESITKEGLALLPDLNLAMTHLTKLKAVGPATASAILCAAAPEIAPFMADESVLSVPGLGKLDYTQKHYMTYAAKVQEKAKELSQIDGYRKWSAHDVEMALWSYHFAKKLKPELLDDAAEPVDQPPSESRGKRRKEENSDDHHHSEEEEEEGESKSRKKRKL